MSAGGGHAAPALRRNNVLEKFNDTRRLCDNSLHIPRPKFSTSPAHFDLVFLVIYS